MNNIPISDKQIKLQFPDFELIKLSDSINLYYVKDDTQNLVRISFTFKNGANNDLVNGVSQLMSMMFHSGTSKYTAEKLAETIEYYGSSFSANHNMDYISIETVALKDFFKQILDLISEVILDSQFPEEEFVKAKKKLIASYLNNKNDISYLCSTIFSNTIFSGGYNYQTEDVIDTIESLTIQNVLDKYNQLINNTELTIIVAGNFDSDETIHFIKSKFQNRIGKDIVRYDKKVTINSGLISAIDKKDSNQCHLKMGKSSIDIKHPDYPYVSIVNIIFGAFFQSRLNKILREEKGYTYGISSIMDKKFHAMVNVIESSIKIDKVSDSLNIILDTYRNLNGKSITEDELKIAVRFYLGSFLRQTETPIQILKHILQIDFYDLGKNFYVDFIDKISNATLQDVHSAVEKYYSDDGFVISAAGDLNIIKPQLEEFGKVRIFELN